MVMKFTNNATSTLASSINSSVTSLSVAIGQGALFPTLGGGDYFYCTLANVAGTVEIIKVTARTSDTFTIVRGQDGTTGAFWTAGDKVELRLVAASLNDVPKLDEANTFTGANAYGTPASITLTNATGLPVGSGVSGLGTGVATALGNTANATGGVVTVDGSATLTNKTLTNPTVTNYVETVVVISNSGTSQTLALTNGTVQTVTMTGNCTFTMPTATAGKSFILIISTGAGGFTGTFTSVKFPNNTAPTLTTTASRWDILTFVADGTNWYGNSAQAYQ